MGLTREIEYSTEVTNLKQTKYKRYWTAISVTWGIFTICGCVMNIVAFIQPQWIGDTEDSPGVGFFGLYERCERLQGGDKSCRGDFMNFNTILNNSFKAASILMGISNLCMLLCVLSLLLFFFIKPGKVFKIAGWLQLLSCACIVASVVVYPNGWGDKEVMRICGNKGKYDIGRCFVRWAYILAIVLFFNGFALAVLAFMLTNKQADLLKKQKEKEAHLNEGFTPDSSFNKGSFGHSSNGGSFMKAELTGVQAEDHGDAGDAANLPEKDDIRL